MGFSFAAAIGAWFADSSRPVICIIGDGGMQMNIQELQTVINYGVKIKIFIIDNRCYGITKSFQKNHNGNRFEASCAPHYIPPDFCKVAQAYGIHSLSISRNDEIKSAIKLTLAYEESVICIVKCPDFCDYWPAIKGWSDPIEDMSPKLPRDEFRANMLIEPLPGWETGEYK